MDSSIPILNQLLSKIKIYAFRHEGSISIIDS